MVFCPKVADGAAGAGVAPVCPTVRCDSPLRRRPWVDRDICEVECSYGPSQFHNSDLGSVLGETILSHRTQTSVARLKIGDPPQEDGTRHPSPSCRFTPLKY